MKVWMGSEPVVVVSGRDELKTLLHDPNFDFRQDPTSKTIMHKVFTGFEATDPHGIIFSQVSKSTLSSSEIW